MPPTEGDRAGHPCVGRACGHPPTDHLATPELAAPAEVVVWCVSCHRHEVRRPRRLPWVRSDAGRKGRRFSRPA